MSVLSRRWAGFVVVAAIVVIPVAAVLAVQFFNDDDLDATSAAATAVLASPTNRTVTDERQVRLVVESIPGPEVVAGNMRGLVTAVYVQPGATIEDGTALFQVDGVNRIGFASVPPFYRPITTNTEGDDVAEIHRLLVLLGFLDTTPTNPRLANFATGQAIGDLAVSLGAARTTTFDPGWVVWLPQPGLQVASVELKLGQPAPPAGTALFKTPGTVTSARINSPNQEPLNFAPGVDYVAIVDGEEFRIDTANQAVVAEDLPRLRAPEESERDGIPATSRRKTPLHALAVPSSAVMTNEKGTLCVWLPEAGGFRAVTVTVAGARSGVTNVASGISESDQVLSNPAQALKDPQCP